MFSVDYLTSSVALGCCVGDETKSNRTPPVLDDQDLGHGRAGIFERSYERLKCAVPFAWFSRFLGVRRPLDEKE